MLIACQNPFSLQTHQQKRTSQYLFGGRLAHDLGWSLLVAGWAVKEQCNNIAGTVVTITISSFLSMKINHI